MILRWHLQLGVVPLPKATSSSRQSENLGIFDFELDAEQMETITSLARVNGRISASDPAIHEEF